MESESVPTVREAVLVLSAVYNEHGRASEAWEVLEANRVHFSGTVSNRTTLRFLSRVVQALIELHDYEKALEWARHLTDVSEAAGDKISGAIGLRQMAFSFLSQHKFDTALELTKDQPRSPAKCRSSERVGTNSIAARYNLHLEGRQRARRHGSRTGFGYLHDHRGSNWDWSVSPSPSRSPLLDCIDQTEIGATRVLSG